MVMVVDTEIGKDSVESFVIVVALRKAGWV